MLKLSDQMVEIPLAHKPVKFPEGTRVMIRPSDAEVAMGWEAAEGRVVVAGSQFYVVQLDEEFRSPTNPDGYVDIHEDGLEEIV